MSETSTWVALAACAVCFVLALLLWRRTTPAPDPAQSEAWAQLHERLNRLERDMRQEVGESARGARQELSLNLAQFQQSQTEQLGLMQKNLGDTLNTQLQALGEGNARRMAEVRDTLDQQLQQLQKTNAAKLDEKRQTVDEKLQTTLETR